MDRRLREVPERAPLTEAVGLAVGLVLDRERRAAQARGDESVTVALDRRLLFVLALALTRSAAEHPAYLPHSGTALDVTTLDVVRDRLLDEPEVVVRYRPPPIPRPQTSPLLARPGDEVGTVPPGDAAALERLAADAEEFHTVVAEAVEVLGEWIGGWGRQVAPLRSAARWVRVRDFWLDRDPGGLSPVAAADEDEPYLY